MNGAHRIFVAVALEASLREAITDLERRLELDLLRAGTLLRGRRVRRSSRKSHQQRRRQPHHKLSHRSSLRVRLVGHGRNAAGVLTIRGGA